MQPLPFDIKSPAQEVLEDPEVRKAGINGEPPELGVQEQMPQGYLGQLFHPFKRRRDVEKVDDLSPPLMPPVDGNLAPQGARRQRNWRWRGLPLGGRRRLRG